MIWFIRLTTSSINNISLFYYYYLFGFEINFTLKKHRFIIDYNAI